MQLSAHKEITKHPLILSSVGIAVCIIIASAIYYVSATRAPDVSHLNDAASSTAMVIGSGIVEPSENPNLAFVAGGRVTFVRVHVGDKVSRGELLASLDTAVLSAQRAGAQANADAAQARLAEMLAGARQEDVRAKQTSIDQANVGLANAYTNAVTNMLQSYDKTFSGLSQYTDTLFNQVNSGNPTLAFSATNSQLASSVVANRISAQGELASWQSETAALSSASSHADIEMAAARSLDHARVVRTYCDQLLTALGGAIPTGAFPQSSLSAAQVSVGAYRDSINSLIASIQSSQQQIAAAKLTVQSANDALNQVKAGSTPEQIASQRASVAAAQANVDSIDAQIRNQVITAPFTGTVASVHVKSGDIVAANAPALSLNPESALQVAVYFSEIDITKIHVGDTAQVTLDAYGNTRVFDAHVVAVDSAPTQPAAGSHAASGYKATLQFLKTDPAIASGMTANSSITLTK